MFEEMFSFLLVLLQSDTLLGLLEQISELAAATADEETKAVTDLTTETHSATKTRETFTGEVVGPTTEELESFKELIHFDHIYYKPQEDGVKNGRNEAKLVMQKKLNNPKTPKTVVVVPHNASLSDKVTIMGLNGEKKIIRKVKAPGVISSPTSSNSSSPNTTVRSVKMVKILPRDQLQNNSNIENPVTVITSQSSNTNASSTQSHQSSSVSSAGTISVKQDNHTDGSKAQDFSLEFTDQDLDWLTEQLEKELVSTNALAINSHKVNGTALSTESKFVRDSDVSSVSITLEQDLLKDSVHVQECRKRKPSTDIFDDSAKQSKQSEFLTLEQQLSTGVYSESDPFDFLNIPGDYKSSSSGYGSDMSDIGSPKSEGSSELNGTENMWEESFTELFPALF